MTIESIQGQNFGINGQFQNLKFMRILIIAIDPVNKINLSVNFSFY